MPETANQKFNLIVPITGYTIRKDAKGVEKYVVTGLASNTNLDLTGERMADSAIDAMVKSLDTTKIYLNNEHGSDWDDDFGEVTKLWSTEGHELMMEAELDPDHYRTKTLIKALDKGKKLGLSIGGYVKKAAMEWFEDAARMVMTYKDISLFHVAITGTPAVAATWVTPITKSVKDWKEMPMPNEKTIKSDEVVETPVVETVVDAPAASEEIPAAQETPVKEDPSGETPDEPANVETSTEPNAPETTEQPTPADGEQTTTTATPAQGDQPEATKSETTKSEVKDDEPSTDTTTDPEPTPTPAEPEAPEQKDDAPASAEPAPDPAEGDTSEVAKSTIFDGWTTADITEAAFASLSYELQWHVWLEMASTEKPAADRLTAIKAALTEYGDVAYKVAEALIQNTSDEDLTKAADAFKAQSPDAVSKSLTKKDAKLEELTKAVQAKDDEVNTLQKSLADQATELETTTNALTDATAKITTFEARKGVVFDKFNGPEPAKGQESDVITAEAHRKFAGFIFNGAEES